MNPKLLCVFLLLSVFVSRQGFAQGAKLKIDHLSRLADKAKNVVDINLDESMLRQASAMGGKQPDAKAQAVLQGLKAVYVKSFEFKERGAYSDADVEAIRVQLKAPGWSRIVSVREEGELTEIYTWSDANGSGGLAIIAAEAQELTVVNLIGRVNIAQLGALQGLGIPGMPNRK
jgi:outer membrane lipoprotein-sorting protein